MQTSFIAFFLCFFGALGQDRSERSNSHHWVRVEDTGTWCGAKGLWLVARGYGRNYDLEYLKNLCQPTDNPDGNVSLLALQRAAARIDLDAVPAACSLDALKKLRAAGLTVHKVQHTQRNRAGQTFQHCLVFLNYKNGRFHVLDPFLPAIELELTDEDFAKSWTGDLLVIADRSPGPPNRTPSIKTARFTLVVIDLICVCLFILVLLRTRLGTRDASS